MPIRGTTSEVSGVLLRRVDVLESLLDESKDKQKPTDWLDVSRSTEADRCRMLSLAHAHAPSTETIYEQVLHEGMGVTVIFQTDRLTHTRSSYSERHQDAVATDRYTAFAVEQLPFGLFLTERADEMRLSVRIYDRGNNPVGLIANDTGDAIEWGEQTYRVYKQEGERATS